MHSFRAGSSLLALALALSLDACAGASKPKAPPPLSVTTTQIRRETLATFETLDGQVDPFLQANVATEQGGTIVKIFANEGDRVSQGQALAKIDDAPLRATLAQQQGARGAASAKLSEAQTQLPITNTLYASALTQAEELVTQDEERLIADRANVTNTRATFVGDEQLVRQGYVAKTAFEQARATYVAARQMLAADDAALRQAQAGVAEARRNLLNSNVQQHVIEENQGDLQQAEGTVQLTQTQLGETVLAAPFSGVVTSRLLDPGAYASPNQAIYQLSQIDPTYVDFNLKDVDLAYVHEGTIVSFTTSAHPGRKYQGTVGAINAVPTAGTLLYRARIVMRNPDYSLRGGMLVAVKVTKEERRDVLVAPRDAVTQNDGSGEIFAVVPNDANGDAASSPAPQPTGSGAPAMHAHRVAVKTGIETDTYVEIVSPNVHDGMTIVATRPDQLQDKTPVAVAH